MIAVQLREDRPGRGREFVEIDLAVLIPIDQRRGFGAESSEAAIVLRLHFLHIDAAVMIGVARCELALQRRFHLVPRDDAVAVAVEGEHESDVLLRLACEVHLTIRAARAGGSRARTRAGANAEGQRGAADEYP